MNNLDETIKTIEALPAKRLVLLDGAKTWDVSEDFCDTDDLKSLAAELREQLKAANYLIGLVGKYYPLAEDAISFELMEYVRKPADNIAEVGNIKYEEL